MFESAVSPAYFVLVVLATIACVKLLSRWAPIPPADQRFATIDGLRGYLALMVFVHHACIWYYTSHGAPWRVPPSRLYTHLGQSSVALFFMITGFLFFNRILRSGTTGPDWLQLAISRIFRLVPLYFLAILLMVTGVLAMTGWVLREPVWQFTKALVHWLLFTITYAPPLNGVQRPGMLLAGVVWSLPYEWFFYGCLPLLALLTGRRPPWWASMFGLLAAVMFWRWQPQSEYLLAFGCGMAAAMMTHSSRLKIPTSSRWPDLLAIALLTFLVLSYDTAVGHVQMLLLGVVFSLIANGASLFKLLLHPLSRLLGEMAYGIYLLHGLLLFTLFRMGPGQDGLTPQLHWAAVISLVPALIALCWVSHRWLERPAMQSVGSVVQRIRPGRKSAMPVNR